MNGENQEKLPLGRWRHFKGGEYQVYGVAIHSETEEEYVVYRPLYGEGKLWIRPLSMFWKMWSGMEKNRNDLPI